MGARNASAGQAARRTDGAVPIRDLLRDAGYDTAEAEQAARRVLDAERITRPGKSAIASYKKPQALAALAKAFVIVCGEGCRQLAPRDRVPLLSRARCEICGKSNNRRAMLTAARAMRDGGIKRLLVVGGEGEQHRALAAAFGEEGIAVQGVDGTSASHSMKDAQANMRRADLLVIWGSTRLRHAVSNLYTSPKMPRVRTLQVQRRSIEALCGEIVRSLQGRPDRGPSATARR
jgi:hypothetical protein